MTVSPAATHDATTPVAASELIRAGYEAFAAGDVPAVLAMFADDIVWHISGRSPVAGIYTGHDEVLDFFGLLGSLSNGTFRLDVHAVLAGDGDQVAAIITEHAERNGVTSAFASVHVWRVENGKATHFQAYMGDEYGVDEFWSS